MFQASEVRRSFLAGALMPWEKMFPGQTILIERDSYMGPLLRAHILFSPREPEGASLITGPAEWDLGPIVPVTDAAELALLRDGLQWDQQQFGVATFRGEQYWTVMVRSADAVAEPPYDYPFGFDGGSWYASAVWLHEYAHGLQPYLNAPPGVWDLWPGRYAYPVGDVEFGSLQHLENAVVAQNFASPREARAGLETFLAVRERRRALFAEQVAVYELWETAEGIAAYVEGEYLSHIGREAVSPDTGKVYSFPQRIPDAVADPDEFFSFFWSEMEYSTGCALGRALTVLAGKAWQEDYCSYGREEYPPNLVDYVRQHVSTPSGEHADALVVAAAQQYNLAAMEDTIREVDFVARWDAHNTPTTIIQDESDPECGATVTNANGDPRPYVRLLLQPDLATTNGDNTILIADINGKTSARGALHIRPDLPPGRHVVGTLKAKDFRNPGIELIHTVP